jgi:hypothetical protein
MLTVLALCGFVAAILYLWHVNRAISASPTEAKNLAQKPWTIEQIREAYKKAQVSPIDVKPFLFPKKNRRYVVVGGSGKLVSLYCLH